MQTSDIMEVWAKINGIVIREANVENDKDTNMEKLRGEDEMTDDETVQMKKWNEQQDMGTM